jgi:dCMP deaminase
VELNLQVPPRLPIEEYALALAVVASMRSEDPWRKVGAAALTPDNRVIATAYNGLKPGFHPPPGFWEDREARLPFVVHAEQNLLSLTKRGEIKTVAVTLLPCGSCARDLIAHGVQQVVFGEIYERDETSLEIFKFYGVSLRQIPLYDLYKVMLALLPPVPNPGG